MPQLGLVWCSTSKAVHSHGGAHARRFVANAGVLLSKGGGGAGAGPRLERSDLKQGVVWRSIGKAGCKRGAR